MADYDVIVVGSGAGGLSAAPTVARSGRSVLLLEAMPSFGGYLNPFQRQGYTFDTGLHYLAQLDEGEAFWQVLEELGIREAVQFVELDPDGFDRFAFPDYEFALPKGRERFQGRLIDECPQEERGINRFFEVMVGPEVTADQTGIGRFFDFTSGIEGLYLAGAGALGGGISTCMSSGIGAARKAVAYVETTST